MEKITPEEIEFLKTCDLYQVHGGLLILTENDEGARLDKDDLLRLSEIFTKYAAAL